MPVDAASRSGCALPVSLPSPRALWCSAAACLLLFAGCGTSAPDAPPAADGTGAAPTPSAGPASDIVPIPESILDPRQLAHRREVQLRSASSISVFHNFQFVDRLPESGITFRNKIVDDAGRLYEAAHYDHGNGLACADIDGDGLIDLYFLTQAGPNELWRNLGGGRFENITAAAGVALADRISVSAAFGDIDNDGDPDLFVTTVRHGNVLFENLGNGQFRDISQAAGVDYRGHSSGAVFFDYNRDGRLDLFVANVGRYTTDEVRQVTMEAVRNEQPGDYPYYRALPDAFGGHLIADRRERSILYRNDGDRRFTDVTEATGLIDESWSGDASPCDLNDDGWPDLYVLNMQGHDECYINLGGERFERRSQEYFPRTPWGSMGVKFFDFDNDGQQDLFLTDMHSDMSEDVGPDREYAKSRMRFPDRMVQSGRFNPQPGREYIFGNAFFRREGTGKYQEISDHIHAENYWPWGLSVGDLNADGFDDAFITASMNYPFRYAVNSLLLNDRGLTFRHSEFILGVEPRRDGRMAAPWFALDCDGADRGHRVCQEQGLTGRKVVWSALGSKASALIDLDGDGDLDIVTNEFNGEPLILISNLSEQHPQLKFLKIRLIGTQSNRDGLGATVTVEAQGKSWRKVYDGLSGYLSHSLYPLYYGLGDAAAVDRVTVTWPSGQTQVIEGGDITLNSTLTITEPAEPSPLPSEPQSE